MGIKKCPKCGQRFKRPPALSRVDNKTDICEICAMTEAIILIQSARDGIEIELFTDRLTEEEKLVRLNVEPIFQEDKN